MKRQPVIATCAHCGSEFTKRYQAEPRSCCSRACGNKARRRQPTPDSAARGPSAYPGAEWGPLPPALLIRVAAHVLAIEYVAWAAQRKATNHVDNPAQLDSGAPAHHRPVIRHAQQHHQPGR